MSSVRSSRQRSREVPKPRWPSDPLVAMSQKKRGKDPATVSLHRLIKKLVKAKIPHAVMGGMAVWVHGYRRFTDDVDVLLTPEGLEAFRERFVPKNYEPVPGRNRRFLDRKNGVVVDLLVTGGFPGFRPDSPILFPDPAQVRQEIDKIFYIDLVTLIQLKLAARRHQDFADVVNLIAAHNLNESFLERLHPALRPDFIECLEEKRREEEYEAQEG